MNPIEAATVRRRMLWLITATLLTFCALSLPGCNLPSEGAPPEAVSPDTAFRDTQSPEQASDELIAKQQRLPDVGSRALDFELPNHRGESVRLSHFEGKSIVALVFHPALFRATGCDEKLVSLRSVAPDLKEMGVTVLGISFRPPDFNAELVERKQLPFDLLSDEDFSVITSYGVFDGEKERANRITVIIDRQGIVRIVDDLVFTSTHGQDLLRRVRPLVREARAQER